MRLNEAQELLSRFQRKYPHGSAAFRVAFFSHETTTFQVCWNICLVGPGRTEDVTFESEDFNEVIGRLWKLVLDD